MPELLLPDNQQAHRTTMHHVPEHNLGTQAHPSLETQGSLSSGILRAGSIAFRQLSQADPKPTAQIGSELKRLTTAGAEHRTTESNRLVTAVF
jgi:hypothetical protein